MTKMRVRFAPSPTGPFHIGGARSALFNWLLAKKTGGDFVLRIEDTDRERSTKESEENIKAALRWLGFDWNEGIDVGGDYGPYRQTERLDIYSKFTQRLLDEGKAYPCYCSEEELEADREAQMAKGLTPRYSGKCRALTAEQVAEYKAEGRKSVIRFRVPENQTIAFHDAVRGDVAFDSNGIGDFVIVKSDGIPVYNYAVVLDDSQMHITHVIRAEEHLSNTPRQILLYQALDLPLPVFGHISLILGKDRTKMSKRHGATSVDQYRKLGYLPEAIVNFLALLGWAPGSEQELFTADELIEQFSFDRVAKNPAVFDVDKLNWLNAHYIRQSTPEKITALALPYLEEANFISGELDTDRRAWLVKVVAAVQDKISYIAQITDHVRLFFEDQYDFENDEAKAILLEPEIPTVLEAFYAKLNETEEITVEVTKAILKAITKELRLGGKKVYMPIRIALTGQMHGPELYDIIPLLGKERVLNRIQTMAAKARS